VGGCRVIGKDTAIPSNCQGCFEPAVIAAADGGNFLAATHAPGAMIAGRRYRNVVLCRVAPVIGSRLAAIAGIVSRGFRSGTALIRTGLAAGAVGVVRVPLASLLRRACAVARRHRRLLWTARVAVAVMVIAAVGETFTARLAVAVVAITAVGDTSAARLAVAVMVIAAGFLPAVVTLSATV